MTLASSGCAGVEGFEERCGVGDFGGVSGGEVGCGELRGEDGVGLGMSGEGRGEEGFGFGGVVLGEQDVGEGGGGGGVGSLPGRAR